MLKTIFLFMSCLVLTTGISLAAPARENFEDELDNVKSVLGYDPASPETALISPTGAFLQVRHKAAVTKKDGMTSIVFVLPPDCGNLQLAVPGHTILRWSSSPALINTSSEAAGKRAQIERELSHLSARLLMVNARIALWQGLPKTANVEEVQALQSAMSAQLPALALEQAELERRLKLTNDELSRMPAPSRLGEKITVILAENVPEGTDLPVEYSYTHDGCGWDAMYIFNALPKANREDVIDVRLLAEVWQFTGLDWKDTKITLATRGSGPREPAQLHEWIIDSQHPSIQPRVALKSSAAVTMALTDNETSVESAPIVPDTASMYATWQLQATGLPQGRVRMQIAAATWKVPLHWLARPSKNNGNVWLLGTYTLPTDQVWPAGQAEFLVNNQSVGTGIFKPRSGTATLYFGADPRVNVQTVENSRSRGESGFISASKTYTWSWTYIITNEHSIPVNVKVERPAPFIVDSGITVTSKNTPAAQVDEAKHMYFWDIEVPAHGRASIDHSVTLSAPAKLPPLPEIQ